MQIAVDPGVVSFTSSTRPRRYRLRKGSEGGIARRGDEKTPACTVRESERAPRDAQATESTRHKRNGKRGERRPQQAGSRGSDAQRSRNCGRDTREEGDAPAPAVAGGAASQHHRSSVSRREVSAEEDRRRRSVWTSPGSSLRGRRHPG